MTPDQLISTLQHAPQTNNTLCVVLFFLGTLIGGLGLGILVIRAHGWRMLLAALLIVLGGGLIVGATHATDNRKSARATYVTRALATYVHDTDHVTALAPADLDEQPAGTPSTAKFDALRPDGTRVHVSVTWGWGTNTPLDASATLPTQTSPVAVTIAP